MRGAVLGAAAALLIANPVYVPAASPDTGQVTRANATTTADGNSVTAAGAAARAARADTFATSGRGGGQRAPVLVRHMRAEVCGVYSANRATYWPCDPGVTRDHTGECGERQALAPWWQSTRSSPWDGWGEWTLVQYVTCLDDARPTPEQILTEFHRLPLTPSALHLQPDRGWVLVNKETIAYTDPAPQVLTTEVLGTTVTFTLTPETYTWDYGETTFTTTTPGHPYPDQDVSYPYERLGTTRITLTTTWSGTYTLDDDPTALPVPGTATTSTTSSSFDVVEVTSHLVRGDCTHYPDDPGC